MTAMTAAEYRQKATALLTADRVGRISDDDLRKAEVWSRLAISAAISETGSVPTDGETVCGPQSAAPLSVGV